MTLRNKFREFVPIVLLFVIINSLFLSLTTRLNSWQVDRDVVIAGNLVLFAITFFSFLIAKKGLQNENPHAFVRAVYSSIIMKLFACIIAAFIYIALNKTAINKPALFICMGLYLVYTFLEVFILMKMLKQKKNE